MISGITQGGVLTCTPLLFVFFITGFLGSHARQGLLVWTMRGEGGTSRGSVLNRLVIVGVLSVGFSQVGGWRSPRKCSHRGFWSGGGGGRLP